MSPTNWIVYDRSSVSLGDTVAVISERHGLNGTVCDIVAVNRENGYPGVQPPTGPVIYVHPQDILRRVQR